MGNRLVPNNEGEFLRKLRILASTIAGEPARFQIADADAQALKDAALRFEQACQATRSGDRTRSKMIEKREARAEAKKWFVRCISLIRMNESLSAVDRFAVGIVDRPKRLKPTTCPAEPPRLKFVRALHENGATPVHELEFRAMDWSSRKPAGAVRLELFIDLIPPDEPIPTHPGANHGSRPWYLRSYTRSPIRLTPPMAKVPMRIVYWARWADSTGNFGPFSATAAAWIEGGNYLPSLPLTMGAFGAPQPIKILDQARAANWPDRDPIYRTALLEAQDESYTKHVVPALPEMTKREIPQLAGPRVRDEQVHAEEAA